MIVLILALSIMIITAIITIFSSSIRKAVILNGIVSSFAAFIFLLLLAPDVALAEAVIGSTLSTIVILMAIRHIRIIHVVYNSDFSEKAEIEDVFNQVYSNEEHDLQFAFNKELIHSNISNYPTADYIISVEDKIYIFSKREASDYKKVVDKLKNLGKDIIILDNFEERNLSYEE